MAGKCGTLVGFALFGFEPQIGVLIGTRGDTGVGLIQKVDETLYLRWPIQSAAQCTAHQSLGVLPLFLPHHSNTRVGIADAKCREDIPTLDCAVPGVDGRKYIRLSLLQNSSQFLFGYSLLT